MTRIWLFDSQVFDSGSNYYALKVVTFDGQRALKHVFMREGEILRYLNRKRARQVVHLYQSETHKDGRGVNLIMEYGKRTLFLYFWTDCNAPIEVFVAYKIVAAVVCYISNIKSFNGLLIQ